MSDLDEEEVARIWSSGASAWKDISSESLDPFRNEFSTPAFLDFVGKVRGMELLDIGCATGRSSRLFAEKGAQVTGIDIADGMLELARKETGTGRPVRFLNMSVSNLAHFEENSFDRAVSVMAIMDVPGFERGAKEVYRILKPGGEFAFSVRHPCFRTAFARMAQKDGRSRLLLSDYFRTEPWMEPVSAHSAAFPVPRFPYKLSDYINFLTRAGFHIREVNEPRPSPELIQRSPSMRFWSSEAALLLFVKARK